MDLSKLNNKRAILTIALAVVLVYANTLVNQFVWDDNVTIVHNNFIKSWSNVPLIFSKSYLAPFVKTGSYYFPDIRSSSGETSYRPVTTLSYMLDYSVWKLNPFGYHLTNLALHLINAILIYLLIYLITQNKYIALLASLLFALHPVNSEAINNISNRKDLLAFSFYLSALILYIKIDTSVKREKAYYFAASILAFFFALFSKEISVTLPLVLIMYDRFFIRGQGRDFFTRFKSRYIGYVAILAFYIWVRFFLMVNTSEPPVAYHGTNFYSNCMAMARVVADYITWVLLPINIPVIPPTWHYASPNSLFDPQVIPSIALIVASGIIAVKLCKISKKIYFGALWCLVTFLPVSNIIPLSNYAAGRYLYLPLVGACFSVSVILAREHIPGIFALSKDAAHRVARDSAILILVSLSVLTVIKNMSWKNEGVFLLEMEERYPDNKLVHVDLGSYFRNKGFLDKAIHEYKIAIQLDPGFVVAYNRLGVTLGQMGKFEEAAGYLKRAIKADSKYAESYNNLGVLYAEMKKYDWAKRVWTDALQLDPANKEIQNNLRKLEWLGY